MYFWCSFRKIARFHCQTKRNWSCLDKVKTIQKIPAPRTEKEVRGFLGRLNYISRFISHITATCEPIIKLLKKYQGCVWMDDWQRALESIKEYLLKPPILLLLIKGRPLIMYLTVLDNSMGCILGKQDKSWYSMLEKTWCALV